MFHNNAQLSPSINQLLGKRLVIIIHVGEALVSAWGTELLDHASLFGPMVLVALPEAVTRERGPHSYQHAEAVQNTLYHQFHIEVRNLHSHHAMLLFS